MVGLEIEPLKPRQPSPWRAGLRYRCYELLAERRARMLELGRIGSYETVAGSIVRRVSHPPQHDNHGNTAEQKHGEANEYFHAREYTMTPAHPSDQGWPGIGKMRRPSSPMATTTSTSKHINLSTKRMVQSLAIRCCRYRIADVRISW